MLQRTSWSWLWYRWLDITPISRIITRCTQDISTSETFPSVSTYSWAEQLGSRRPNHVLPDSHCRTHHIYGYQVYSSRRGLSDVYHTWHSAIHTWRMVWPDISQASACRETRNEYRACSGSEPLQRSIFWPRWVIIYMCSRQDLWLILFQFPYEHMALKTISELNPTENWTETLAPPEPRLISTGV